MLFNKRSLMLTILVFCLGTGSAYATDLDTFALVTIVEGITLTENTALNFGDVALKDGTITVGTDGLPVDPSFMSFDGTNISQGVITIGAVAGSSYNITLSENVPIVGLTLDNFNINIDGGADEAGSDSFVGVTLANAVSTLNLGADLTVNAATASLGVGQTIGYRVSVVFF